MTGEKAQGLDLIVQKTRGVYLNAKVLNLDDKNLHQAVFNSYVLLVKVSVKNFRIQVLNMTTLQCIFDFKFRHLNAADSDIYMTPITKVNPFVSLVDIKTHMLDAIKNLNSEHLQEQIESNHIRIR